MTRFLRLLVSLAIGLLCMVPAVPAAAFAYDASVVSRVSAHVHDSAFSPTVKPRTLKPCCCAPNECPLFRVSWAAHSSTTRFGPVVATNTADDFARAEAARDATANSLGRKHATYAGGTKDGRVVAGCSSNPIGCAENDIARQLGSDAQMTGAKGWRRNPETGQVELVNIPVCTKCQGTYGPEQFPPDVQADPGGPWGR
jgi:hypothetical protein